MTAHVHEITYLTLKTGSATVCLRCQKMLSGPEMSDEEEKALIAAVKHLREKHAKKDPKGKV